MPHCSFIPGVRLGNYMFEIANCISYSLRHNLDFTAPLVTSNEYWSPIYLKHLQDLSFNPNLETINIYESGHEYNELPFEEEYRNCNIILNGYYQSEKYFLGYREELLYLFDLPYELKQMCSIHARYGDYLTIEGKHIVIDEDYLKKAMSLIKERTGLTKFKVFSDDIEYFKKQLGHLYDFEYSWNTDELSDMIEISCCHSNINSSSTFSWWGAWLNQNKEKIVITPEKWFQDGHGLETKDIIPKQWIKL